MNYGLLTIEGNIGSGKTSLATKIADQFNARLILEQFADNPFLPKFYEDPDQYAFPLELFFMAERYQQLKNNVQGPDLFQSFTVTDYMFTKSLLFARVTLDENEFNLYQRLFNIINPTLPRPGLTVYLYATVDRLLENIKKRGRPYEQNIKAGYLQRLQDTYLQYFRQQTDRKVLVVDVTHADFLGNPAHYQEMIHLIHQEYAPGMHEAKIGPSQSRGV